MSTTPTEISTDIDLNFRPRNYFWPVDLILSSIKGADRRAYVEAMFRQGRERELPDYIVQSSLTEADRRAAGAIHPSLMGGEYLPDRTQREVEIARITIASTTQDVTCVYASRVGDGIQYRVVDEYEGDTLSGASTLTSTQPLTLGELADFFLSGWDLLQVLEMNCLGEPGREDEARAFSWASSEFYPGFKRLIEQRVDAWLEHHLQQHSGRRIRRVKTQKSRKPRNKNIVTCIENDGDFIDAQFVYANGELVIGIYKRIDWVNDERRPRYKNIVTPITNNGEHIYAQFVRNGETVVGYYKLIGWADPPADIAADIAERLRRPVIGFVSTRRR